MNCKYCGAELVEGLRFCPGCGKDNTPENIPAEPVTASDDHAPKPSSRGTVIAIILAVALLVAALAISIGYMITHGLHSDKDPEETIGNSESYTADDKTVIANADAVVATIGDRELTVGELQIYYWSQVYDFASYCEYLKYYGYDIGFDPTLPLDTQLMEGEESTYQEYLLNMALESWQMYTVLEILAEEENFTLDAEYQSHLDTAIDELNDIAVENGYADALALLNAEFGAGCDTDDYLSYLVTDYISSDYYNTYYETINPSAEEVESYYQKNAEVLAEQGLSKEAFQTVDVRHVLIQPEGDGATGADGYPVYTEDAWAACQIKAQGIYDGWVNAGDLSETSFDALAKEYSEDGNAKDGGLYTGVYQGQMVENFDGWIFEDVRQYGDHALVKTQFGYHIMFFVGADANEEEWHSAVREELIYELSNTWLTGKIEQYPMEVFYDKIVLSNVEIS